MSAVRVIMYHYVRSRALGRYPGLKTRDTDEFLRQLDYIGENYHPISADDIREALDGRKNLPKNACLLTFDDGYLDHYLTVFPALSARGWSGAFYPPTLAVEGGKVMEVNKIQLLLAHYEKVGLDKLIERLRDVYQTCQREARDGSLPASFESLREKLSEQGTYDSADIVFIKRLLQYELPLKWRRRIVDELFAQILDVDERTLASEMYMTGDMLAVMAKAGMHIGSHGSSHSWLSYLDRSTQEAEIAASLDMLAKVYGKQDFMWSMCYPFGGYNDDTIDLCRLKGCSFAVTTKPIVADLSRHGRFEIPRVDTNSVPF